MVAQFVLTSAESKFLIAKAVLAQDRVKRAIDKGIFALHPSTTTYCIVKELTGEAPPGKVWVTGMIVPKGLCIEANTQVTKTDKAAGQGLGKSLADPGLYPHTIVVSKGEVTTGRTIYDLIDTMGEGDIYVKGVNAVDVDRKVGVLLGSMAEGTIGKMIVARPKKGFEILCPVGLEKFLPGSLDDHAAFIAEGREYSMGQKVRLSVFDATVINELDAFKLMMGVEATIFAAGGLDGAEGSVSIAVRGTKEQLDKCVALAESVKGMTLPQVYSPKCISCAHPTCHMAGEQKPWVKE